MRELGAKAILLPIFLGLIAWFSNTVLGNSNRLTKVETRDEYIKESIEEIKEDLKDVKRLLHGL